MWPCPTRSVIMNMFKNASEPKALCYIDCQVHWNLVIPKTSSCRGSLYWGSTVWARAKRLFWGINWIYNESSVLNIVHVNMVKVKTKTKQKPQTFDVSTMKAISKCTCRLIKLRRNVKQLNATSCLFSFECLLQGRIQDFFRRGCTRLLLYFNTNKPHSFCFFAEYQLY